MSFRTQEIDLHGTYPDEVEYSLGNALRDARLSGVTELTIIHGKGEGILRGAVLSALSRFKKDILTIYPEEGFVRLSLKLPEKLKKPYRSENVNLSQKAKDIPENNLEEKRELGKKRYLKRIQRGIK
ncbi:MAG: Smr/MutS family protein [Candidatus Margulisiibacteriota bacterium]